jgi:hypothetical protein
MTTSENNDALILALTNTTAIRRGNIHDIKSIQALLRADGLYKGPNAHIDGDFGLKTAQAMMEEFRKHPALMNNVAPWLIRSMEDNGFGKQMRELVAANPAIRQHLVQSALDIVDKTPDDHVEIQTKLSLLNLYNYDGGIDGVKGREQRQAVRDLHELSETIAPKQKISFLPTSKAVAEIPATPESATVNSRWVIAAEDIVARTGTDGIAGTGGWSPKPDVRRNPDMGMVG